MAETLQWTAADALPLSCLYFSCFLSMLVAQRNREESPACRTGPCSGKPRQTPKVLLSKKAGDQKGQHA